MKIKNVKFPSKKIGKALIKTAAGGLMLFAILANMTACDENNAVIDPMNTTHNTTTSQNGTTSDNQYSDTDYVTEPVDTELNVGTYDQNDFDAKKQAFLQADVSDLDAGLHIVPHNYYAQKGLTEEQINNQTFVSAQYFTKDSVHTIVSMIPKEKVTASSGENLVLTTWFVHNIGEENMAKLLELKNNSATVRQLNDSARTDKGGQFEYRYAINQIMHQQPTVWAENYTIADGTVFDTSQYEGQPSGPMLTNFDNANPVAFSLIGGGSSKFPDDCIVSIDFTDLQQQVEYKKIDNNYYYTSDNPVWRPHWKNSYINKYVTILYKVLNKGDSMTLTDENLASYYQNGLTK